MSRRPLPRRWRRTLERSIPSEDRGHVVEELEVLYHRRVARDGRADADRWMRREVMRFVTSVPLERLRRRTGSGFRAIAEDGMGGVWRDVKRGLRSMWVNPGLTAVAIATLTLGIGANTVIYSVVDHVAIRPLPFSEPEELVAVWPGQALLRGEIDIIRSQATTLESFAAYMDLGGFNLVAADAARRIDGLAVEPAFLGVLGMEPILGRDFLPRESEPANSAVVLVSHGFWSTEYGSDRNIVGRSIVLDGVVRTVIGVLPANLSFPTPDLEVLVPFVIDPEAVGQYWGAGGNRAIARLAEGVTAEAAEQELLALSVRMRESNTLWSPAEDFHADGRIVPLQQEMVGDLRPTLLILLGAVGLVLLIACANVANLLLARGLSRERDMAIRSALGATRARIVREHLIESLLLAAVGCAVALSGAALGLDALVAMLPADVPRAAEIRLDGRVATVGMLLSLSAGALAGLLPALRASRAHPGTTLREGQRGSGGSLRRRRLSSTMVVAQVAAAVVLVIGAGLLIRSLGELSRVETGFDPTAIVTARLTLAGTSANDAASRAAFYDQLVGRARSIPGVRSVALASHVPFGPGRAGIATFIDGVTSDPNTLPVLYRTSVTPEYFETMRIPLLSGRTFESTDGPDGPLVVIVDETTAERFWPGESPVGKVVRYPWQGAPPMTVVGVVGGVVDGDLTEARFAAYYQPLSQVPRDVTIVLRAENEEVSVVAPLRDAIADVDERLPLSSIMPMSALIGGSTARARWTAGLVGLFAAVALLLGSVGVYGVVGYSVRERTKEIGVRMAFGAGTARIERAVLADGLRLSIPGALVGLMVAVPAGRLIEGLLFGVSALDPITFALVPVVLCFAAVAAVYLPARRATRVDPVEALRAEA